MDVSPIKPYGQSSIHRVGKAGLSTKSLYTITWPKIGWVIMVQGEGSPVSNNDAVYYRLSLIYGLIIVPAPVLADVLKFGL